MHACARPHLALPSLLISGLRRPGRGGQGGGRGMCGAPGRLFIAADLVWVSSQRVLSCAALCCAALCCAVRASARRAAGVVLARRRGPRPPRSRWARSPTACSASPSAARSTQSSSAPSPRPAGAKQEGTGQAQARSRARLVRPHARAHRGGNASLTGLDRADRTGGRCRATNQFRRRKPCPLQLNSSVCARPRVYFLSVMSVISVP